MRVTVNIIFVTLDQRSETNKNEKMSLIVRNAIDHVLRGKKLKTEVNNGLLKKRTRRHTYNNHFGGTTNGQLIKYIISYTHNIIKARTH